VRDEPKKRLTEGKKKMVPEERSCKERAVASQKDLGGRSPKGEKKKTSSKLDGEGSVL